MSKMIAELSDSELDAVSAGSLFKFNVANVGQLSAVNQTAANVAVGTHGTYQTIYQGASSSNSAFIIQH